MITTLRSRAIITTTAMLLLAGARSTPAQDLPSDSAVLAIIKTRVDSGRAPGIIVGILDHGHRRYVAYGSAGPGHALDEHTLFEIGSLSKTFTALLLADAVTRGEVRLDEPVAALLPPGTTVPSKDGRVITLELLSTHRSGLPRLPTNMAPANPADPYVDYDATRLTAFLAGYVLPRAPGDSAEYSNVGVGLLGYALTLRAHAPSWGALVEQRITAPLGMHETFATVPPAATNRFATGYNERMAAVPPWNFDALAGAGALRSTSADMLTYLAAELDTTTGRLRQAVALGRAPRASFAPGARIALGWLVGGKPDHPIWFHDGGTAGFRSFAAFDPARQVGVVVLANSALSVNDIGMHLIDSAARLMMPMLPPRTAVTLSTAELDRLVGDYTVSPSMVLTISRDGDALFGQATGQPRFPLTATAANRFIFQPAQLELVFDLGDSGSARSLVLRQGGQVVTAPRRP